MKIRTKQQPPKEERRNKRLTKVEVAGLKLLRKRVLLESAGITFTGEQIASIVMKHQDRGSFAHHTPEIQEALERYTRSWILPIIDALLEGNGRILSAHTGVPYTRRI